MPTKRGSHERVLWPGPQAPGRARQLMAEWCGPGHAVLQDAQMLVSELVTNAVSHGRGRIILRAHLDSARLRVEVIDQGSGFEYKARRVPWNALHGRGLAIVDALSSRWGISEGTTHVWFEIDRPGPRRR